MASNRSPELSVTMGLLCILSLIAFTTRISTRRFISRSLGRDDAWLAIALVLYYIFCGFSFVHIHYGTGRHMSTLTPKQITEALKWYYMGEMFYVSSATILRISIGLLLLRITTVGWIRSIIWSVLTISTLAGFATTAELTFQCQPISFYWSITRSPTEGHCIDPKVTIALAYSHAAASCLSDWTLGILPWVITRDLANRKQRIQVACLLCFANFGSIATTIRFYSIYQLGSAEDFLYDSVPLAAWSAAEVGTGLVAASLATLYPLQQWLRRRKERTNDRRPVAIARPARGGIDDTTVSTVIGIEDRYCPADDSYKEGGPPMEGINVETINYINFTDK